MVVQADGRAALNQLRLDPLSERPSAFVLSSLPVQ